MLIQLDDKLALQYQSAADRARVPLQKFLERQLAKFGEVPAGQRALVLTGEALEEVDRLLGIGSTRDGASLVSAISAYAGIRIGDIRLQFSPGQLAEIQHRAEKQGKTPQAVAEDIITQLNAQFFTDAVVLR